MTLNGSGVRNITRVLHISPATVIREFKKNSPNWINESKIVANHSIRTSGGRNQAGGSVRRSFGRD
ncbi:hypothetical protein [Nostoc punctiforme]|uniref:hypothetical protein n=1 Tax=Nostoc punctiforme TaxID=272131 RepID=UPI000A02EDC6